MLHHTPGQPQRCATCGAVTTQPFWRYLGSANPQPACRRCAVARSLLLALSHQHRLQAAGGAR
jgi:hypothetical protein